MITATRDDSMCLTITEDTKVAFRVIRDMNRKAFATAETCANLLQPYVQKTGYHWVDPSETGDKSLWPVLADLDVMNDRYTRRWVYTGQTSPQEELAENGFCWLVDVAQTDSSKPRNLSNRGTVNDSRFHHAVVDFTTSQIRVLHATGDRHGMVIANDTLGSVILDMSENKLQVLVVPVGQEEVIPLGKLTNAGWQSH